MVVTVLEGRALNVRYEPDVKALENASIVLSRGELCAVIGPNGAGKSTLLRVLGGLEPPTAGKVLAGAAPLAGLRPRERARRIAFLGQRVVVPPALRVDEVVLSARYAWLGPFDRPRARDRAIVAACLDAVDATALAGRIASRLSGGERQRVLLARAFAQQAPVLLLDEPTASLDPAHQLGLLTRIRGLVDREQRAVLLVTHDLNLASQFADRVVLLDRGRCVAEGPPGSVLTPAVLRSVYGECLVHGTLASRAAGEPRPWVLPWLQEGPG